MTKLNKLFSLVALVLALGVGAFGQASLTQTTLSAFQGVGPASLASGISTTLQTTVSLASATGITTAVNGQPVTYLYVDQEAEAVLTTVVGQTTIFNVLRGQMGTKEEAHASGTMVLAQLISPQFGGNAGSGGLQAVDAPFNGACTAANTAFTPWVNVVTGDQWLCSTVTNSWVPGWRNRYAAITGSSQVTAAVASAAGTVTPSGPLFHITGALAITGFNVPVGFNATAEGGGGFCIIPDGAFTTTTAGNIALASTAVVNKLLCYSWDATNSKFVPTY